MILSVKIENMATVESAEAGFSPGLNVLTGETGAGKSVVAGAIAFAAGAKAGKSIVRDGAKEARVEAVFELRGAAAERVRSVLDGAGVSTGCDDGESDAGIPNGFLRMAVVRTVGSSGGGRAWINNTPATVQTLAKIGAMLVDVHGAGANGLVKDESFRRRAIDACGDVPAGSYKAAWSRLSSIRAEIAGLEADGRTDDEIDMLRYQTAELEEAAPGPADDDIGIRQAAAAHAGEALQRAQAATEALGGDRGAAEILAGLAPDFAFLAKVFPDAGKWEQETNAAILSLQELSRSIADAAASLDCEEEDAEALDRRLSCIERLKRKYLRGSEGGVGGAGTRLAALLESKKARLSELEGRGEKLERLRREEKAAFEEVRREGAALTRRRVKAASAFSAAVTRELRDLGFMQASFDAVVEPRDPGPDGCDAVRCLFAPNPGEGARELSDIASSGETARVMLAVKRILSSHDGAETVVFDEIDANVGGETGRAVGAKLKAAAEGRQVVAITHLPQTAAFADRHLKVSKSVRGGRTRTSVAEVRGEERVRELARMLGGVEGGAAWRHAEELIYGKNEKNS